MTQLLVHCPCGVIHAARCTPAEMALPAQPKPMAVAPDQCWRCGPFLYVIDKITQVPVIDGTTVAASITCAIFRRADGTTCPLPPLWLETEWWMLSAESPWEFLCYSGRPSMM